MTSSDIRKKYIEFFKSKEHKEIAPAPLVPENDPTTLFTSSGMQPLIPYLLGQTHPEGKRLVNSQPCFRAEDIEEVGDNRHTTFFEMLGNWSLGDPASPDSASQGGYFKQEQLSWFWEFLTQEIGLPKEKLYVSVFEGDENVPEDKQSLEIWKNLGVAEDHIYKYGVKKNWWSRSGTPDKMPAGEIGGPDSEVFYEFTQIEHDPKFGDKCHPNCDCGRFMEIGNSVFIQYIKKEDGSLEELAQRNVDFGGGLERITAASNDDPDVFNTDLFKPLIKEITQELGVDYVDHKKSIRVISDHLKAATFLIKDGVVPSNKLQGYVARRLLRRAALKAFEINKDFGRKSFKSLVGSVSDTYSSYFSGISREEIEREISLEVGKFRKTIENGLKETQKIDHIDGRIAFDLYQTFGFPYEVTEEIFREKGQEIDREQFKAEFEKHKDLSRTASAGMFKGGLADHSEVTIKYHTTTHLLHQALRDVLGDSVFQKGSNITAERLRFDFSFDRKMTDEEVKQVEEIINDKINQDLKVDRMMIPIEQAKAMNAIGLFNDKYASEVSVYGVGSGLRLDPNAKDKRDRGGYYSLEFCGGPHVGRTGEIGKVKIVKEEAVSAGMRRIRVELD